MSSPPLPRSIVKASHGQEVRRFVVQSKSYEVLYAQIAEIFDIPKDSFVLKFHDDEGDLCSITSDLELDYAISNECKIIVVGVSSEHAPEFSTGAAPAPEAALPSTMDASQPEYVFKISCGDQVRRLATRSHSYEAFYASIARAFDMPIDSFVLQFHDEDGDLCSITSDIELEYALEYRSNFIIKELDANEEPARSLQLIAVDRSSVSTTTAATMPAASSTGLPYPQAESSKPIAQSALASPMHAAASLPPPPPVAASSQPNLVAEQQRLSRRAEEFHREALVLAAKAAQMQSEAAEFQRQAATYQQQAAEMALMAASMAVSQSQSQPQSQAPMQPLISLASIPSVAQLSQAVAAAAQQAAMLALNQLLASNPFHHAPAPAPAPAIAAAAANPSVAVAPSEPIEYAAELEILQAAGFTDRATALELLRQHGGNVQKVMDSMLV